MKRPLPSPASLSGFACPASGEETVPFIAKGWGQASCCAPLFICPAFPSALRTMLPLRGAMLERGGLDKRGVAGVGMLET